VLQADGTVITFDVTVVYVGSPAAANNLVATATTNLTDVGNLTGNLAAASNGSVEAVQVSSAPQEHAGRGGGTFTLNSDKAASHCAVS
jgi:hypothetical protein